jgi:TRAP-type C4-dicarboxylate transport system permease small subunit
MAEYVEGTDAKSVLPESGVAGVLNRAATWLAMSGGFVFCLLIAMSIVSIVGRKLFASPVQGDVELMQMGAAVGAAAFLPICEMHDNHIKVDALTSWMSTAARAVLDTLAHLMLTVAAGAITWRTAMAAKDAMTYGEVSTLLSVPVWQPVALLVPSFALLTLCGLYRVVHSFHLATGRSS